MYRALDRMLPHEEAVERRLKARLGELSRIDYDLLLHDVTSTYFEGLAAANPQAQRGYSRDHRPDCKQVCIALVVTRDGLPLSYEVFDGNRVDVTTVESIVTTMEERFGAADRVWVMDRGMVSEKNIAWLRAGGRKHLIGASKSDLRRMETRVADERVWIRIREDVEVKLVDDDEGGETFVLRRSQARRENDRAIVERCVARLDKSLASLRGRLERSRMRIDRGQVEHQVGRMLERNSRAAGIFVRIMAYVLWKTLEQWTRRAGLGDVSRAVLDELAQFRSVDVVLPTTDGAVMRLRCVVKPDPAQAMILERLGLAPPRRLPMSEPAPATTVQ